MTPLQRNAALAIALVLIGGAIWYLQSGKASRSGGTATAGSVVVASSTVRSANYEQNKKIYPMAMELVSPVGYINTPASTTLSSLLEDRKVVLIDFWTYSCINCERTIPYLNAWYQKYKDYGFTIVGVHTPEFGFEKVQANVEKAVRTFGIAYPVVLDNNYDTWSAYRNRYWPAGYLIDIDGLVRERTIGEGNYEKTEDAIQELLAERAKTLGLSTVIPQGYVDITTVIEAKSPETYFNYSRNSNLGNGPVGKAGVQSFVLPQTPKPDTLYLGGTWDIGPDYAQNSGPARIQFSYDAAGVYIVASSPDGVEVQVLVDGKPITADKGADVRADGTVRIQEPRLYKLIQGAARAQHTIEIVVPSGVLQAYTFTFG